MAPGIIASLQLAAQESSEFYVPFPHPEGPFPWRNRGGHALACTFLTQFFLSCATGTAVSSGYSFLRLCLRSPVVLTSSSVSVTSTKDVQTNAVNQILRLL